ncbi:NB-ARC domain-containing protein [Dactylosporangium sp. CS-033363]|uniref:NB-ARC domain-containing protein n=1 Tax=Dactylosporangium sp. CS-033363 TaxID=3239935 RepID=UPI003D94A833
MARPPIRRRFHPLPTAAMLLVIVAAGLIAALTGSDRAHLFAFALAGAAIGAAGPLVVTRVPPRPPGYVPPSNLPPPPTFITGREELVAGLRRHLGGARTRRIVNLHGVAGIGKTALGVYTAHLVAGDFKAGQLFARFMPETPVPVAVGEVRRRFIAALSPADAAPPGDERAARAQYRRLARQLRRDNQLLIVLDDVHHAALVRPLLPRSRWCAVVVTSRERIPGLLGSRGFPLGPLAEDAALRMLGAIVGERVDQERTAATHLVRAAACHPLAIHLVGMALANRPNSRLDVAFWRMSRNGSEGTFDDALDLAYSMLTRGEQRALTTLGLLGRPHFAHWELGALLDEDGTGRAEREAFEYCLRLTGMGLLERRSSDAVGVQEFRLLDHVERYAGRLTRAEAEREDGRRRQAAARRRLESLRHGRRAVRQVDLRGVFEREHATMDAGSISRAFKNARDAVALARDCGDGLAEAEATVLCAELHAELGGLQDVHDLLTLPLRSDLPVARIRALRLQAKLHRRQRQLDEARRLLDEATAAVTADPDPREAIRLLRERAIVESLGDEPAEARPLIAEARRLARDGHPEQLAAIAYAESRVLLALDLLDEADEALADGAAEADRHGQELARTWIGYEQAQVARHRGDDRQVVTLALAAMERFDQMRHRYGSAHCREIIGRVKAGDDPEDAVRFLAEALETFHNCGDEWIEANTAERLGRVQAELGNHEEAAELWRAAERLYESICHHYSSARAIDRLARVRRRLARTRRRPALEATGARAEVPR